jgi:DNA-binding LacI/PurR family transcriptional regulator/GAF domain-containing protein
VKEAPKRSGSRPTIGLLINSVLDPRDTLVWAGALEAAADHDADLVCFPGGTGDAPSTAVYDLVSSRAIDGVVLELYTTLEEFLQIHKRIGGLPVANVLRLYQGYPGVIADNYQGMRDLLEHLIDAHGYQRIALLRGPEGNVSADARYRAYVDALAEHGLDFAQELVLVGEGGGSFDQASGGQAVDWLLDEYRGDVDVIASANDDSARGVFERLKERGLDIPYDMAVTGFDDLAQSRLMVPPLTTVAQPWREMGKRAVEIVLAQIEGEQVAEQTLVPCKLIVRQSCACWSSAVSGARKTDEVTADGRAASREAVKRQLALSEMAQAVDGSSPELRVDDAALLLDACMGEVQGGETGSFLQALDAVLRRSLAADVDVLPWQEALSVLHRYAMSHVDGNGDAAVKVRGLLSQGRVLVGEAAVRAQTQRMDAEISRAAVTRQVGQALLASLDMEHLAQAVAEQVPRLGVPGLYLSVYERARLPSDWSKMVLAHNQAGQISLEPGGRRFLSQQLLPTKVLDDAVRHDLLVEPLYAQDEHLGFFVAELGHRDGRVYDSLREQLGGALRNLLLAQQAARRTLQLQTAAEVGRAASSVLDPDDLMQQVVDLVLNRLGLYYAGIFLMDETGEWSGESERWAVLRAGTGQAGRQMLAQGHKLEVGGASMVGQCIARGKGRIALDVGREAVRFDNPLLPHTRSELALPLVSRGQIIGAMTIQSALPSAFSQEDIAALQLMSDQLANAIQTARLYLESQETVQRIQTLYETSRVLSSTLDETSLMRAVLQGISQRMGCEYAIISVVDEAARMMESRHGLWQGEYDVFPEWMEMSRYSLDEPDILVDVYRSGQFEIISGWDDRFNREIYERFGHERLLRIFMPIRLRDRVTGVIEVAYDRNTKEHIGDDEVQLLGAFVDQAAVALENARLLSETQRALDEAEMLYTASQRLASASEAVDIVAAVAESIQAGALNRAILWAAERGEKDEIEGFASWANWDRGQGTARLPLGVRYSVAEHPSVCLAFSSDPLFVRDILEEDRVDQALRGLLAEQQVRALALLPVWRGERQLGTLMLMGDEPHAFSAQETRLLESLAGQMVVGLDRLSLLSQAQERLQHEQILRQVTDRIRNAVEVETVMRTAVQEIGRALGRSAFVYLGNEEELQ